MKTPIESNPVTVAIGVLKGSAMALRDAKMIEAADCLSAAAEGLANQNAPLAAEPIEFAIKAWIKRERDAGEVLPDFIDETCMAERLAEFLGKHFTTENPAPSTDCTDWPDKFWKLAMRYYQNSSPGFNHECEKLLKDFLVANKCTLFHESEG